MVTRILKRIPSLATLFASKWFIGILAAGTVAVGSWLFFTGQMRGLERGFDRAEAAYADQIEEAIDNTVTRRDDQWVAELENAYDEITAVLEQNKRTLEQERELTRRITELQQNLSTSLDSIRSSDIGECNLSDEFDSLFLGPDPEATGEPGATPSTDDGKAGDRGRAACESNGRVSNKCLYASSGEEF